MRSFPLLPNNIPIHGDARRSSRYLLGALSDDEMRRIARLLSDRPELRDQLDALEDGRIGKRLRSR